MTIAVVTVVVVTFFSKNNLTPPKPMRFLRAAFRDLAMFFILPPLFTTLIIHKMDQVILFELYQGERGASYSLGAFQPLLFNVLWKPGIM